MDELLCVDKVKNKELFDWASSTLKKKSTEIAHSVRVSQMYLHLYTVNTNNMVFFFFIVN